MMLWMLMFVEFAWTVALAQIASAGAALCGNYQGITSVKLPHDKDWLSIQDFETFILNKTMGEMYYALPRPPPFTPSVNYFSTVISAEGMPGYLQINIGEYLGACSPYNVSLSLGPVSGRALFYGSPSSIVEGYWSNCPSQYVWKMRCANFYPGKKYCDIQDMDLGVLLHGNMDDVPVFDIVEDLDETVGVKMGAADFKWFFTYGENTVC